MIDRKEQDEAGRESNGNLDRKFIPGPDADPILVPYLYIVIPETQDSKGQGRQQNDPDVGNREIRPEERGDHDGGNDEAATHRGSPILHEMSRRNIFPDDLLHLKGLQLPDQPGSEHEADEKGR